MSKYKGSLTGRKVRLKDTSWTIRNSIDVPKNFGSYVGQVFEVLDHYTSESTTAVEIDFKDNLYGTYWIHINDVEPLENAYQLELFLPEDLDIDTDKVFKNKICCNQPAVIKNQAFNKVFLVCRNCKSEVKNTKGDLIC